VEAVLENEGRPWPDYLLDDMKEQVGLPFANMGLRTARTEIVIANMEKGDMEDHRMAQSRHGQAV
jgi:hypothetical protein